MNAITAHKSAYWQPAETRDRPEDFEPEAQSPFVITLLSLYIFLLTSRALDISRIALLHIPMILLALLVISMLAKGDLKYSLRSKTTVWFLALNAWICVCFPFSRWRAGSLPYVVSSIEAFGVYFLIVQLVRNSRDWQRVAKAYAWGALGAAMLSFFFGQSIEGRVAVVAGSLADPNEFALRLVLGLPFWWYLASQSGAMGKIMCFMLTLPIYVSFARAGSRSALLALIALFAMMFLFVNLKQKALMCTVAVVGMAAGAALLPAYLKVRFTTLFTSHDATQLTLEERERLGGDVGSSESREMLLWQAIRMTGQRPIVGVGPGVFGDAAWNQRKADTGVGGGLLVSHNTYTQFSSETGIPGFLCFVMTLLLTLQHSLRDYRRNREHHPAIARGSLYVFVCLVGLAAGVFFLSVGYGMLLPVVFGLAASLHMTAALETAKIEERAGTGHAALPKPSGPFLDSSRQPEPRASARKKNIVNGRRVRLGRFVDRGTLSSRPGVPD